MSNVLHLFAKDTNGVSAERGFHYQHLKTLDTWLKNRTENIEEDIFCDYEEDIFGANVSGKEFRFRQIKFYKGKFSFSQEEISKAIVHFFMLYANPSYQNGQAFFFFETNSSPTLTDKSNSTSFLSRWANEQGNLTEPFLSECLEAVKLLLHDYFDGLSVKDSKLESLELARQQLTSFPDQKWTEFIRSIRWVFEGKSQDDAMSGLFESIKYQLWKLPIPLDRSKEDVYLALLQAEIVQRTIASNPEDKKLTHHLLDIILLKEGAETKWYGHTFEKWSSVQQLHRFSIEEVFELAIATEYFLAIIRNDNLQHPHTETWLRLVDLYLQFEKALVIYRRKLIYCYIRLYCIQHGNIDSILSGKPTKLASFYFEHISEHFNIGDYYNDIALLTDYQDPHDRALGRLRNDDKGKQTKAVGRHLIALTTLQQIETIFESGLEAEYREMITQDGRANNHVIMYWVVCLGRSIKQKLENESDVSRKCKYLEVMGQYELQFGKAENFQDHILNVFSWIYKISPLLQEAEQFSAAAHYKYIQHTKKLLRFYKLPAETYDKIFDDYLDFFEEHVPRLLPFKDKADRKFKDGLERLSDLSPGRWLNGLDLLHQSQILRNNDNTEQEYIKTLTQLAIGYGKMEMWMASKYYALTAMAQTSMLVQKNTIACYIEKAIIPLMEADYRQGLWEHLVLDMNYFFLMKRVLAASPYLDPQVSISLRNIVGEFLAVIPHLPERYRTFVANKVEFYNELRLGFEKPMRSWTNVFTSPEAVEEYLDKRTSGYFNDSGSIGLIEFKALGIVWEIMHANSYKSNMVAQEFSAYLQVVLSQIQHHSLNPTILLKEVSVQLMLADGYLVELIHKEDEKGYVRIYCPVAYQNPTQADKYHVVKAIEHLISLISDNNPSDVRSFFDKLENHWDLYKKLHCSMCSFQRVYFRIYKEDKFGENYL